MIRKNVQGFTLIELLVVIAIIGILSAVVLSSLNDARKKGSDAKVKSNLSNLRSAMELYYSTNIMNPNSYRGGCNSSAIIKSWNSLPGGACESPSLTQGWSANAELQIQNQFNSSSGQDYWCVDNTGVSKVIDALSSGGPLSCP